MGTKVRDAQLAKLEIRIQRVQEQLDELYAKRNRLQKPGISRKQVLQMAMDRGMSTEDIAERLGLSEKIAQIDDPGESDEDPTSSSDSAVSAASEVAEDQQESCEDCEADT